MIPTIQVVYGTMPKIWHYDRALTGSDLLVSLNYDSEFYLFKDADGLGTSYKILKFLNEQFDCKISNNRKITYYFLSKTLYLTNIDSSKVINTLISDDFYDSFQVLLSNLKTQ